VGELAFKRKINLSQQKSSLNHHARYSNLTSSWNSIKSTTATFVHAQHECTIKRERFSAAQEVLIG